ncbi:hypothetical protein Bbelb_306580 [Branchiostoma belcheri]|nr:hypothetical protein Bbelb_306580 [Branchiostoma belcheri]
MESAAMPGKRPPLIDSTSSGKNDNFRSSKVDKRKPSGRTTIHQKVVFTEGADKSVIEGGPAHGPSAVTGFTQREKTPTARSLTHELSARCRILPTTAGDCAELLSQNEESPRWKSRTYHQTPRDHQTKGDSLRLLEQMMEMGAGVPYWTAGRLDMIS